MNLIFYPTVAAKKARNPSSGRFYRQLCQKCNSEEKTTYNPIISSGLRYSLAPAVYSISSAGIGRTRRIPSHALAETPRTADPKPFITVYSSEPRSGRIRMPSLESILLNNPPKKDTGPDVSSIFAGSKRECHCIPPVLRTMSLGERLNDILSSQVATTALCHLSTVRYLSMPEVDIEPIDIIGQPTSGHDTVIPTVPPHPGPLYIPPPDNDAADTESRLVSFMTQSSQPHVSEEGISTSYQTVLLEHHPIIQTPIRYTTV